MRLKELVRPYYLKWLYFRLRNENCPAPFRKWTEYPAVPVGPSLRDAVPNPSERPDVVVLPMADWHGIFQRTQQLTREMARLGHRCLYVNPHLGREFPQPYGFSEGRLISLLEPGVLEAHIHLPREPVFHHRLLTSSEDMAVTGAVCDVVDAIESARQFTFVSFPLWANVARRLRDRTGAPIVYDCHDFLEGFTDINSDLLDAETALLRDADLVVFSADWLAETHAARMPDLKQRSVVIRNAVDASRFRLASARMGNRGSSKTVGYIGSINSWFDVEAVIAAAEQHPDWRFLLTGPMAEGFSRTAFSRCSNVVLTGEAAHAEVADRMSEFDAAIIPFLVQPLTQATNPVKLYEYFACGLPVVSSPLPEIQRYSDLVYLASTPEEFVRQLETAVAEHDEEKAAARRRVAEQESWRNRGMKLLEQVSRIGLPVARPSR
jgi:O-antigen biosynthesis protein